MILNEKQIAILRSGIPRGPDPVPMTADTFNDMADTIECLWKVYRAARKWTRATAGSASVDAESDMMDRLNDVLSFDSTADIEPTQAPDSKPTIDD